MTAINIPVSGCPGIVWPALPPADTASMLALYFQMEQSQWWPPGVLQRHQLRQMEELCAHASRTVPLYEDRLKGLKGLRRGQLSLDKWRQIPLLARATLLEQKAEMDSLRIPKEHLPAVDIATSGATGQPVTVKSTAVTRLFSAAMALRYHHWHGRDFSAKTCAVTVPHKDQAGKSIEKAAGWVPGYRSGPMINFDITRPVSEQLAWLAGEDPAYLITYPNNLRELLRQSAEKGLRIAGLRQVAAISEVLDDDLRALVQKQWGVPVVDAYSAQEVSFIALQCPDHGGYHVQAESLFVEILDAGGAPCDAGQVGRVVVTDLKNFASPLIRYEIGDYAEVGGACACGRGLPVLTRILGRSRNMLRLANGDSLWPRIGSGRFAKHKGLRQVQLIQTSLTDITVNLCVAMPFGRQQEDAVRALIGGSLGDGFTLHFRYVDEIPRAANGKFEDFKCEIAD